MSKQIMNNILVIVTDQLTWRALPAYGDVNACTPAINSISDEAVIFDRCYTPCPLCLPARAAFWTGRYPHETKAVSNGREYPIVPVPQEMPTLGDVFYSAGYNTVHFGKQHDAGSLRGFLCSREGEKPVKNDSGFPLNGDTYMDRYTAETVVEFLKESGDKPFFAVADFVNPHNICGYVGSVYEQSVPTTIFNNENLPELPENFSFDDIENRAEPVKYICCSHVRQAQVADWGEDDYRRYLAAYYYYLKLVDGEIAKVLNALNKRPDARDTLVVFMADHGDSMASRGRVTKQVDFYEEVVRVPFFFAGPGIEKRRIDTPVSLLDLFPTLCSYAGIKPPEDLVGMDLMPLITGQNPEDTESRYVVSEWHTEWGFTVSPGRMIVCGSYKYITYIEDNFEELYDLSADPFEKQNRAADPGYTQILERMRSLFDTFLRESKDPFRNLEWKADGKWRSHKVGYHFHKGKAAPQ